MKVLERKGYLLRIPGWMGNLGNHLIQLSGAINVARRTQSWLTVPAHSILRRRVYDFSSSSNDSCREPVESTFFFQADCFQYPIVYDSDRREILQEFVIEDFERRRWKDEIERLIHPRRDERVTADTLVINIRSGEDIFRTDPPPQGDYMQPPLSFYKQVISDGGYDDCLIVTERARLNPCISGLLAWNPSIRIKTHTSVTDDARTLLSARHLIMCHSTFSWCMALMSKNLEVLHQPSSFRIRGVKDYEIHTHEFANYIRPGEWSCSPAQITLMIEHPLADVREIEDVSLNDVDGLPPRSNHV